MSDLRLVIATRQSQLALWQANFVSARLREAHPDLTVELLGITTRGDRWLSSPLAEVGGKGLFIKELEEALAAGRADLAVHSVKDVPAELPEGFAMPVIAYREDPRDVLVTRDGGILAGLPAGARVGSSSLRRRSQLLARRPDLLIEPIRGNVDTRLRKLDDGEYDALVLAAAGLARLGLAGRASEYLATEVCLPAAGQGALGIECRWGDDRVHALLEPLEDPRVAACVSAERTVSAVLGADCTAPLAAHATPIGEGVMLQ
ncbi:MAG: hydroxymethylbilane synthase, partial [Gammaproteobacteria bacterium]|nr:hydroxymethylbilane synthase [Gammaproteobacteria bacterium]